MRYLKKSSKYFTSDIKNKFFAFSTPMEKYENGSVRSMADVDAELALLQV
jgi:hypothetical protein